MAAAPQLMHSSIADLTDAQTHAIQTWVHSQIETQLESRLTVAGRAFEFMQHLDTKKEEILKEMQVQAEQTFGVVDIANATNKRLEASFADLNAKLEATFVNMQVQIESAQSTAVAVHQDAKTSIDAGAASVADLHEKTRVFAAQAETEIQAAKVATNVLREEVRVWSVNYGEEVKQMLSKEMLTQKLGKPEHGEGSTTTSSKLDKKEVSVWKLQDNVTKLDFGHWLDAIDFQLEAIHGFAYPDLVPEKVQRFRWRSPRQP